MYVYKGEVGSENWWCKKPEAALLLNILIKNII